MTNNNQNKLTILRRPQVEERTGLSRSTIYLFMEKGDFPKPINLGPRSVGWIASEIDRWIDERIEQRDSNQVEAAK